MTFSAVAERCVRQRPPAWIWWCTPLINNLMGRQPSRHSRPPTAVSTELYNLIGILSACGGSTCPTGRTATISMAACTALLSSATTSIK